MKVIYLRKKWVPKYRAQVTTQKFGLDIALKTTLY